MSLEKILENPDLRKVAKFFHENPAAIDTPRGIATWVGIDPDTAKKALEELAGIGALIRHKIYKTTAYGYTNNKRMIAQIAEILKNNGK